MKGKIKSGQLCTVTAVLTETTLKKGNIVLCKVKSLEYLHLIKAIRGEQFQMTFGKTSFSVTTLVVSMAG